MRKHTKTITTSKLISAIATISFLAMVGCASGTWQQKTRTALSAAAVAGARAADEVTGDAMCRPFVDQCKAKGDRECAALQRCQISQQSMILALQQLMQAIGAMNNSLVLTEMFQAPK